MKKVFIRSGIRFDYVLADSKSHFLQELADYHVSGQLRVAPEHVADKVLEKMGKPSHKVYLEFLKQYYACCKKSGKEQYAVPYFMSSHPGCGLKEAVELAEYLRIQGVTDLSQVQYAILETSGAISTFLYPKYEPAPAKDAGVQVGARKLPITVIASGRLMRQNLTLLGRDEAWVQEILKKYNCRVQDVYLLTSEPGGKLYFAAMREDEA